MLVGAVVGGVFQHALAPPPGIDPVLWHHDLLGEARQHPEFALVNGVLLSVTLILFVFGWVRTYLESRLFASKAKNQLRWLVFVWLPVTDEIVSKFRSQIEDAARLIDFDQSEEQAYRRLI